MGLGVFTPALLIIGGLCGLALIISVLNFAGLHSVKSRMITRDQQDAFTAQLLSVIDKRLGDAAAAGRDAVETLRGDYQMHVTEIAEVKASHAANVRHTEQMMASYTRIHQMLVERLLSLAAGDRPTTHAVESDFRPAS